MIDTLLHKFYSASISFAVDGTMLVTSTRERTLAWGMMFCFIAALSLIVYMIWRQTLARRIALGLFVITLVIPVFIMPAVRQEYIQITPDTITIETGQWHLDSRTELSLNGLMRIREEQDGFLPGNLIGDPNVYWNLFWNNGQTTRLELNDFSNAHRMVLAHYIRDRGYIFERLEDRSFSVFPLPAK